jgi:membrane associated rhomboid family serine protease
MEGRRWPVVTFALIALNFLVFFGTHWKIMEQTSDPARAIVRAHLILLAAMHPELDSSSDVQALIKEVQNRIPAQAWKELASPKRPYEDDWDEQIRAVDDSRQLQQEMNSLGEQYAEQQKSSILANYAFVPAHATLTSYLTSMFLHTGWLHIIGNMWFLWLAGFVLEDRWGRVIYPIFYLLAGIVASIFHTLFYPGSIIPALGASGAVAALMGGFLIRFPKLKIEMLWYMLIFRIRFKAYAYWLLPIWLLSEVFYGTLFGQISAVAHWAHVGGFLFGVVAALIIQKTGLEHQANAVIEDKIGWTADPAVVQGTEFLQRGEFAHGIAVLKKHIALKPDAMDAYALLRQLFWRKNEIPAYLEATIKLCQLHLKAQDSEAAWQDFEEYTNAGGDRMPPATWLELCRILKGQQHYEKAVTEYEHLAKAFPNERPSLLALLSAGRLTLKQLNRPSDALRFYNAAKISEVPHADWDSNIQAGIENAEKALVSPYTSTSKS